MFRALFLQRERRLREGMDELGSMPKISKYLLPLQHIQTSPEAQPASYSFGTVGSFPRVNRPGRKPDHISPPNAQVKNKWSFRSISPKWRAQKYLNVYLL